MSVALENFMVRYYPKCRIIDYPWVYCDRYEDYLPKENPRDAKGHIRTGNMCWLLFSDLKLDIAEHGIENPFIIEYYCKDLPNRGGFRDAPVLAIRTGNNRAECMKQLGLTDAPALFVVPKTQIANLPTDPYIDIALDRMFEKNVAKLWKEVERTGPNREEPLGIVGAWRDSKLLTDIIREIKNVKC